MSSPDARAVDGAGREPADSAVGAVRFRQVRPGLYERIGSPHQVEISARFRAAIRAENPRLAELLAALDDRASGEG